MLVKPPGRGIAFPSARNLAFMFVRYRFSMALWAAFFRFMTAAASVSCACTPDREDLVFDILEEIVDLGEASGEDGEEVEDDEDALEGFRGLVLLVLLVVVLSFCWEDVREVTPMASTGDKLPLLMSLLCDGDHISLSGSWHENISMLLPSHACNVIAVSGEQ